MDKLQLPHAQLFHFCSELYKRGSINESEKLKMKELVINDDPEIFELLKRYQQNEPEFVQRMIALLRRYAASNQVLVWQEQQPQQQQQQVQQTPQVQPNQEVSEAVDSNEASGQFVERHPDCPEEISSPLGFKLMKRKQRQHKQVDQKVKEYLRPFKIQQEE